MASRHKVLIFGHSHAWALRRVLETGEFSSNDSNTDFRILLCGTQKFPGSLVYQSKQGTEIINPSLISALADHPASRVDLQQSVWLISAVQGNYYNIVGMLDEQDPFDFVVPGHEDIALATAGQLVPYGAIQEALLEKMSEVVPFYRRLGRLGYAGIVHLGAPPPNPSSQHISDLLNADSKMIGKSISVSSPLVRLKLWMTQERLLTGLCRSVGVEYLGAPAAAFDSLGFLRTDLCKDAVHGNSEYAILVLKDLERSLLKFSSEGRK